jgi:alkylation response protein AidB-like acyl-CoA dehydrogenase
MLADSAPSSTPRACSCYRAAAMADTGRRYSEASMAKLFASEAAPARATGPAGPRRLRLHREFPVERHLRDAKLCEIGEGTSEVQRMIIARRLLGR